MKKVCINTSTLCTELILTQDSPLIRNNTALDLFAHDTQLQELQRRGLGLVDLDQSLLVSNLKKKISGYKQQDLKMEQKDGEPQAGYCLISLAEVMKKLTECEMVCYYCQCKVFIRYKAVKEPTQWTLDRKDNDYGHTNDNTLIACLKCNLARRVMPLAKFTFTKHLKITKKGE
jgi:hypothetical protein